MTRADESLLDACGSCTGRRSCWSRAARRALPLALSAPRGRCATSRASAQLPGSWMKSSRRGLASRAGKRRSEIGTARAHRRGAREERRVRSCGCSCWRRDGGESSRASRALLSTRADARQRPCSSGLRRRTKPTTRASSWSWRASSVHRLPQEVVTRPSGVVVAPARGARLAAEGLPRYGHLHHNRLAWNRAVGNPLKVWSTPRGWRDGLARARAGDWQISSPPSGRPPLILPMKLPTAFDLVLQPDFSTGQSFPQGS